MSLSFCKAHGCEYPDSHTTFYHKCGTCGAYGHGPRECYRGYNGSYDMINALSFIADHHPKTLPPDRHCLIPGCPIPQTHSTASHTADIDIYANERGPDYYGVRQQEDQTKIALTRKLRDKPGYYAKMWWGMGNFIYCRNINGNIEFKVCSTDNSDFITNLREITE